MKCNFFICIAFLWRSIRFLLCKANLFYGCCFSYYGTFVTEPYWLSWERFNPDRFGLLFYFDVEELLPV